MDLSNKLGVESACQILSQFYNPPGGLSPPPSFLGVLPAIAGMSPRRPIGNQVAYQVVTQKGFLDLLTSCLPKVIFINRLLAI